MLICMKCSNYAGNAICKAFPEGIPDEIFTTNSHDKPLDNQDNKIVFVDELEEFRKTGKVSTKYEELDFENLYPNRDDEDI